jgi:hypothetical protein
VTALTVIDEGREARVEGRIDGDRIILSAAALEAALGFVRKPEGLCKGDLCVPLREGSDIEVGDGDLDAARLARVLERPVAVDAANAVAFVGPAAGDRAARLESLVAPDFTLPDLDGALHSLSDHRGKKVVLAAYASW